VPPASASSTAAVGLGAVRTRTEARVGYMTVLVYGHEEHVF